MAKKTKADEAARVAPPYEANWQIDPTQDVDTLIDRHARRSQYPAAHEAYRRAVEEKRRDEGVIHVDPATGYRARFHPADAAA